MLSTLMGWFSTVLPYGMGALAVIAMFFLYKVIRAFIAWKKLQKLKIQVRKERPSTASTALSTRTHHTDEERKRSHPQVERLNNPEQAMEDALAKEEEKVTVVGFSKPIGFWTEFVSSRLMTGIDINKFDPDKGFWVNFINAQTGTTKGKRFR